MFDHKLIAQLCTLTLMTFPLSAQTYTNHPWVYTLNESNEAIIVGFGSSSGDVAIPSQIDGFSVTQVGSGTNAIWPLLSSSSFTNSISNFFPSPIETTLIIPETVKIIAPRAFLFGAQGPPLGLGTNGTTQRHFVTSVSIGANVTTIGEAAFGSCSGLTSLTIPDNVSHIGPNAFAGTRLANIVIGAGITDFSSLGSLFDASNQIYYPTHYPSFLFAPSSPSLRSISVSSNNPVFSSVEGVLFNKSGSELMVFPRARQQGTYIVPDSVTSVWSNAFHGTGVTNIYVGSGITNMESLSFLRGDSQIYPGMLYGFGGFIKSPFIHINVAPNNPSFSSVDGVVFDKSGNQLLVYPGGRQGAYDIPANVQRIADYAFHLCFGLTSLTIPGSVMQIGTGAFWGTALTNIFIGAGITNIESLSSLRSEWPFGLASPGGVAPPPLEGIQVSEDNTSFLSISGVLFDKAGTELLLYPRGRQGDYALPSGVTRISEKAFSWASVSGLTIASGVTNIGGDAFASCSMLTHAVIPDSVTSIGDNAFAWCWNLARIRLPRPFWNDYARLGLSTNVTIENASLADFTMAVSQSFAEGANSMTNQIEEARTAGKAEVTSNPAAFNLFTKEHFDSNRVAGQSDVINNPMSYGLYTSNSIMDLRMNGLMVQKNGTDAVVSFQPQTTTDLTQPFTNNGMPITHTIPMPGNKGFIRINAKPVATPIPPQ